MGNQKKKYKLKFINSFRLTSTSLESLKDNLLGRIQKMKSCNYI